MGISCPLRHARQNSIAHSHKLVGVVIGGDSHTAGAARAAP